MTGRVRMDAVLTLLSLSGMFVVLLCTSRYGVGTSLDSSAYISAARSLLSGQGYLNPEGEPYTHWPPLFPTLLAVAGLPGIDALVAARLLNALAFGAIIFVSGLLFLRSTTSKAFALVGILAVAASAPVLDVSVMAWSEPVFVLLTVLFILSVARFWRTRSLASLVLVSLIAALACLQRYVGVTVILAGCLLIGLGTFGATLAQRLRYVACFCLISAGPIAAWFVRNRVQTGRTAGAHQLDLTAAQGIDQALTAVVNIVAEWFVPGTKSLQTKEVYHPYATELAKWFGPGSESLAIRMVGVSVVLLLALLAIVYSRRRCAASNHAVVTPTGPAVVFTLTYLGFLVAYSTGVSWDPFTYRHLVPIYIPLVLLVVTGMEGAFGLLGNLLARPTVGRSFGLGLCVLWLLHPLDQAWGLVRHCVREGAGGYSCATWKESPLVDWLRANRSPAHVYSNAPAALYLLTGIPARSTPHWRLETLESAGSLPPSPGDYIVWCHNHRRDYLYDLRELLSRYRMDEVAAFPDGRIYRFVGEGGPAVAAVYHFWAAKDDRHLYTIQKLERDRLLNKSGGIWTYAGLAFYALPPDSAKPPNVLPVYRFSSARSGIHFYTMNEAEKDQLLREPSSTWTYEGIAFYAWPKADEKDLVPVHRFWSERLGQHFYTANDGEKARLVAEFSQTWTYEGIAWYACGPEPQ